MENKAIRDNFEDRDSLRRHAIILKGMNRTSKSMVTLAALWAMTTFEIVLHRRSCKETTETQRACDEQATARSTKKKRVWNTSTKIIRYFSVCDQPTPNIRE